MGRKNTGISRPVVIVSDTEVKVEPIAKRVPKRGEIYVAKNGKLIRCADIAYSKHAKQRLIIWSPYHSCIHEVMRQEVLDGLV